MDNPVASSCPGNLVDYNSSDNDEPATPPPGPSAHGRKSEIDSSFTDDIRESINFVPFYCFKVHVLQSD